MTKIKGFTFDTGNQFVDESIAHMEKMLERKLTEDELTEVATLWNWNYPDSDCIEMLKEGLTAVQYEDKVFMEML